MIDGDLWMDIKNDYYIKKLSISAIARKYGIDRKTVRRYLQAETRPKYTYKRPRHKMIEDYADYINELLKEAPYSAVRIKELLEQHYNIKICYTSVQQYVKRQKIELDRQATVRFETMPGEQAQVDWGFFENYRVVDDDGTEHKLYCFLMILGYSRMRYIEFVTDMTTETLIRCHISAFNYFGGYPNEILYDNMKQVVTDRKIKVKDSKLNKVFEDFASFFNFKVLLARPYRGQTKGKVERSVRYVRENFMVGIKFKDLSDLNKKALAWCEKVNSKTHAGTNEIPRVRLIEERLNKVERPYFIEQNSIRKVEKDCLFSYKNNKYSVPSEYIYRNIIVAEFNNLVVAYCDGESIATHPLCTGRNQMIVSKSHYNKLLIRQSEEMNKKNTIYDDADYDSSLSNIDLKRYDA